jgi:hypothetical protein
MMGFLKYTGVFVVAAVVMQLFVVDSIHLGIYFAPPVYIAFIVLLPLNVRPIAMLALGLLTGVFIDFFEGTAGLHTAAVLFTAFARRGIVMLTLGRDATEDGSMPSFASLGEWKFIRYSALVVAVHCVVFFPLEALTIAGLPAVLLKMVVSGVVTLLVVWAVALLFTVKAERKT